ncbi:MAG TPA: arginine repressor [Phycisphaerae bacterium]|nr:arginine repressor [Phycisphaerae bacterium]HRW52929.1 arginine repressor [Phycisphaerae bacterium]
MNKEKRQTAIRSLVRRVSIRTQADLITQLRARGLEVDQSTLSRDLAELGIRKSGGRYTAPGANGEEPPHEIDYSPVVHSFGACGPNIIVIKTDIGQAQPVSIAIEGKKEPTIFGTLAGDDTIYVTTKTKRAQAVALRRLADWFGEKNES